MSNSVFSPADILIPFDCGLTKWAVVACDQYTSEPEYWDRVDKYVGDAPSTLRLILPESKLEAPNVEEEIEKIHQTMDQYLEEGRLRAVENSLFFLERKLDDGKTRLGLIGKLDLEQYNYEKGSGTPIRATEGTVLSRIPPRMKVRRGAAVELPHIMVLIDDPDKQIIEPLATAEAKKAMSQIYISTLMEKGGRVTGYRLSPEQTQAVIDKLEALADPARFETFYNAPGKPVLTFAMGDGNHSLATAKANWEKIKATLPEAERADHPARYALIELNNVHDEGIVFEPIHRVVFGVNGKLLIDALTKKLAEQNEGVQVLPIASEAVGGEKHIIPFFYEGVEGTFVVSGPAAQLAVGTLQNAIDAVLKELGGEVDYIHGDDVVKDLAKKPNAVGFLLPTMQKGELFSTVVYDGALPRKTFSMGEAAEKRYYLEARLLEK